MGIHSQSLDQLLCLSFLLRRRRLRNNNKRKGEKWREGSTLIKEKIINLNRRSGLIHYSPKQADWMTMTDWLTDWEVEKDEFKVFANKLFMPSLLLHQDMPCEIYFVAHHAKPRCQQTDRKQRRVAFICCMLVLFPTSTSERASVECIILTPPPVGTEWDSSEPFRHSSRFVLAKQFQFSLRTWTV